MIYYGVIHDDDSSQSSVRDPRNQNGFGNHSRLSSFDSRSEYNYNLSRSQLKAASRTSALLSGFAMVALVEMQYEANTPQYLLILLGVITTLLVSVHLLSLMISTCIRPFIEAHGNSADSPHEPLRFYIEFSWFLSTCVGLVLFLVEIGVILWVKFERVHNEMAGFAMMAILVPVLILFAYMAFQIQRITRKHAWIRIQVDEVSDDKWSYYSNSSKTPIYNV